MHSYFIGNSNPFHAYINIHTSVSYIHQDPVLTDEFLELVLCSHFEQDLVCTEKRITETSLILYKKKDHTNEIDLLQRITKIEKIHKRLMNKTRDNTTKYSQKVQRKITDDSHNRDA